MARPTTIESPAARRGRAAGAATLFLLVSSFTAVCGLQIIQQAFADAPGPGPLDCEPGLESLSSALERARRLASAESGEKAALETFRRALLPEWNGSAAVRAACERSPGGRPRAEDVERLRYAEERALRYEAPELAELRRRVLARSPRAGTTDPVPPVGAPRP
jgi:hypothetical protein